MSDRTTRIFIVDDEPLLTDMLSDFITDRHPEWDVRSFPTGEACLAQMHLNPQLVILDYHLNSRQKEAANGIDILREIKDSNKALPVIMLSSQESYGIAGKTISYGAVHYVIKGQGAFEEIGRLIEANV